MAKKLTFTEIFLVFVTVLLMISKDFFPVFHLNIRSVNKTFETFKEFHSIINFKFSIALFFRKMSRRHKIQNFIFLVIRPYIKQEKIVIEEESVFLRKSYNSKLCGELSINCNVTRSLSTGMSST